LYASQYRLCPPGPHSEENSGEKKVPL